MTRLLLAIDGIDGSGKTRFAARLEQECQNRAVPSQLLRVDDFRCRIDWDSLTDEAAAYYTDYYDFVGIEACLRAFLGGAERISVPTFDSVAEQVTGQHQLVFTAGSVLLLEGVFTLRAPAAATGTLLYLHTSYPEARRRIIARDVAKNRRHEEVERRVDRRYFPSQKRYHDEHAPRDRAHLVIDNENPARPRAVAGDVDHLPAPLREAIQAILTAARPVRTG